MSLLTPMQTTFTTRELAELLSTKEWRVRRLFEDGTLPEPQKFGGKRVIPAELVGAIVDALSARGWLPDPQPVGKGAASK